MQLVAIATDAAPVKKLGGPGRFAPSLFENLFLVSENRKAFIGLFCGQFACEPREVKYYNIANINNKKSSLREKFATQAPNLFVISSKIKRFILSPVRIRELRKRNIDIIHAHDFSVVDRLRKFPGKIVLTNHYKGSLYKEAQRYHPGMDHPSLERRYLEMERSAIQRADLITFPSLSAKYLLIEDHRDLEQEIERKTKIIYSGIDNISIDKIPPLEKPGYRIYLNVANHIPDKGIDIALQVFKELAQNDPEARFINVGLEGPETENLKNKAMRLGIASSTSFIGVIPFDKVIGMMKSSTALIHTPRRVVFDLTILEAMAAGIPVIASSALGNIEALGDEHPLILNNQWASIDDMASLLEDNSSREQIIKHQRNRLEDMFTIPSMVSQYLSLYDSLH